MVAACSLAVRGGASVAFAAERMPFSLDAAFTSVAASDLVMPIDIARVWKLKNEILRPAWYGVRLQKIVTLRVWDDG